MSRRGLFAVAALAAALIAPAGASAATVWTVDPSSGTGCSTSNVCKTISDANKLVGPGDTVNIKAGNYTEPDTITITKNDVTFSATPGTVSITIAPSEKGHPVFVLANGSKLDGLSIGSPQNGGQAVLVKGVSTTVTRCFLARLLSNDQDTAVYEVDPSVSSGASTLTSSFVLQAPVASPNELAPPAIVGNKTSSIVMSDDNVYSGDKLGPGVVLNGGDAGVPNSITRSSVFATNATANALTINSIAGSSQTKYLNLDSVLLSPGTGAAGLGADAQASAAGGSGGIEVAGVHVTIAGGQFPVSMSSGSFLVNNGGNVNVLLDRSIVHGTSASPATARTRLTLTTSDVTDVEGPNVVVNGTFTTPDAKLFANLAKRDLHLRPDAPAIDRAGDLTTGGSDKDIDLEPRKVGAATDMGADEFVNKPPRAAFTPSTTSPVQNQQVTFDASKSADPEGSYGGGITTYHWDFGDGQTADTTTPSVQHSYPDIGTYTVKLTEWAEASGTLRWTATHTILVLP